MDDLFGAAAMDTGYEGYNDYNDEMDEEITQEDAWVIITKYFETRGLVKQQIDSFDEFLQSTIQELIDDSGEIKVTPEEQFVSGKEVEKVCFSFV
jgi:DNA-directed RNA polymerase II subunit RPB2